MSQIIMNHVDRLLDIDLRRTWKWKLELRNALSMLRTYITCPFRTNCIISLLVEIYFLSCQNGVLFGLQSQVQKDIPHKSSVMSSRRPVDFSESEREEFEYETEGEEVERSSPPGWRVEEPEQEDDEEELEHDEDEAEINETSIVGWLWTINVTSLQCFFNTARKLIPYGNCSIPQLGMQMLKKKTLKLKERRGSG